MKNIFYLAVFAFLMISCSDKSEEESHYKVVKEIDRPETSIPAETHNSVFLAKNGHQMTLPSGTMINIAPNTFEDIDGNPYEGEVKLSYSEFLTPADIILSGLPMKYDSAGVQMDFSSAGMFEVRAKDNSGKPLSISENKFIEVDLASPYDGDYNTYFLEEKPKSNQQSSSLLLIQQNVAETVIGDSSVELRTEIAFRGWRYVGDSPVEENKVKNIKLDSLNALKAPEKPNEPLNAENESVFEFQIQTEKYAELRDYENLFWKYAGDDPNANPDNNTWIFETAWTGIEFTKGSKKDSYYLKLSNRKKTFFTEISPVFAGKDYKKAQRRFKKDVENFETTMANIAEQKAQTESMEDYSRRVAVTQLGFWNCDKPFTAETAQRVMASTEQKLNKRLTVRLRLNGLDYEPTSIHLVSRLDVGENAVTRYWNSRFYDLSTRFYKPDYEKFYFNPTADNKLVIPLHDGKVAYCPSKFFDNLDAEQIMNTGELVIDLKVSDEAMATKDAFNEFVKSL